MVDMVLGKTLERVQARESYGSAVAGQLPGCGGVQLGDAAFPRIELRDCVRSFLPHVSVLAQPLAAQRQQQSGGTSGAGTDGERRLDRVDAGRSPLRTVQPFGLGQHHHHRHGDGGCNKCNGQQGPPPRNRPHTLSGLLHGTPPPVHMPACRYVAQRHAARIQV
ncbi:hypothetical protein ACFV6G_39105 [Streptomyces lavendulae]|uniref:hypothetical protein n=1 Tax=Streptomyces lavendulae TaxID=1914 RepID=UPI0036C94271